MDIQIKVGVVIENAEHRILLIKEKVSDVDTSRWNIVKGTREHGETVFETAIRECKEEVSAEITLTHSLGIYLSEKSEKIRIQFNFLALLKGDSVELAPHKEQTLRGENIEEFRWLTKEELSRMNEKDFISARTYELLKDWASGNIFPLDICKSVPM